MFLSNAFWVEVWGTPYFSLGSHFLFLLTLVPCCFPSEFVPLFRRLQSGWAASVVCSASAWPASDFSHSQRGQTYVKLFSFSMSSLKESQSLSDSDSGLSPTPHKLAHSLQMLPGSVRELTSQEQLPNQWGAGGGGVDKDSSYHPSGGPFCEASATFSEVPVDLSLLCLQTSRKHTFILAFPISLVRSSSSTLLPGVTFWVDHLHQILALLVLLSEWSKLTWCDARKAVWIGLCAGIG